MAKKPDKNETSNWQVMVDAAKRGLEEQGYSLTRVPGRGLSNVWTVERNGKAQSASIRTTRNRWIAFQPLDGGTSWKTLDDVDLVVVASVVSPDRPTDTDVEVYIFPASDVRKRFDAAYAARINADQIVRDNFGMWVALDKDTSGTPVGVGSGIAEASGPVATFTMQSLTGQQNPAVAKGGAPVSASAAGQDLSNIADVMAWTRQRVAEIAGVRVEAVKLDLKIEY